MSTGKYQKRNEFHSDLNDILESGEMVEVTGFLVKPLQALPVQTVWDCIAAHGMRHIRV
jgi:hypothetical protein